MEIKVGAAYVRVSTDDQLEYSPDSQLKLIRDYAKREGYIIPDEYIYQDDGISGKTAAKRPAFMLMIGAAKESPPPFDRIFVWKYSRFARNQEESLVYKNLLKKNGVTVTSISEPSSDSPFSGLIESIISWMDEYYLINLAGEVRRGMKEKAQRGEAMGTAPYGYTVKDKSFVINENAEIVRYIFEQYASGKGARTLAAELGEKGVKTRRGNVPDYRWVHYILTNPVYIGKVRWSTDGHANYDRPYYNGENVMIVDGKHPAIINKDTWETVQKRIKTKSEAKYVRKRGNGPWMLQGLLRCGSCGATLTTTGGPIPSLQCHKYARGQCTVSHYISISKANEEIIKVLEGIIESGEFVFSPHKKVRKNVMRDWDKLMASEEKRIQRARTAFLDGLFSQDEYKEAKNEAEKNIERLQEAKKANDAQQEESIDPAILKTRLIEVVSILRDSRIPVLEKNEALRSIVDKIVFNRPGNAFDLFFK